MEPQLQPTWGHRMTSPISMKKGLPELPDTGMSLEEAFNANVLIPDSQSEFKHNTDRETNFETRDYVVTPPDLPLDYATVNHLETSTQYPFPGHPPLVFPHNFPIYVLEYFPSQFKRFQDVLPYFFEHYLGLTDWDEVTKFLQVTPKNLHTIMDPDYFDVHHTLILEIYVMLSWMNQFHILKLKEWHH